MRSRPSDHQPAGSRKAHQNHKTPSKESRNCAARTYPLALPSSVAGSGSASVLSAFDRASRQALGFRAPLSQLACSGAVSVSKRRRHQAVIAVHLDDSGRHIRRGTASSFCIPSLSPLWWEHSSAPTSRSCFLSSPI